MATMLARSGSATSMLDVEEEEEERVLRDRRKAIFAVIASCQDKGIKQY